MSQREWMSDMSLEHALNHHVIYHDIAFAQCLESSIFQFVASHIFGFLSYLCFENSSAILIIKSIQIYNKKNLTKPDM